MPTSTAKSYFKQISTKYALITLVYMLCVIKSTVGRLIRHHTNITGLFILQSDWPRCVGQAWSLQSCQLEATVVCRMCSLRATLWQVILSSYCTYIRLAPECSLGSVYDVSCFESKFCHFGYRFSLRHKHTDTSVADLEMNRVGFFFIIYHNRTF